MAEISVNFDDYERKCARFLADRFNEGGEYVGINEFPDFEEKGDECVQRVIARFKNYGLLGWDSSSTLTIYSKVVEVSNSLENPPLPDHWRDLLIWFRSKRWSLLIFIIVALISFLGGAISLYKEIAELTGMFK